MEEFLQNIYKAGKVVGRSGKTHPLRGEIDQEKSDLLYNVVKNDPSVKKTVEVGCAFGLSSLSICLAMRGRPGASHIILDPFQATNWDGVGAKLLEEAGIDFFELREIKSEFGLPQILDGNEGQFDLVFVDGWHTFDQTLLDCFYATRLLRVGGYLGIDDAGWRSVGRAVSFVSNYPCYEPQGAALDTLPKTWKHHLARTLAAPLPRGLWQKVLNERVYHSVFDVQAPRMVLLKKIAEDKRGWDWHDDRF